MKRLLVVLLLLPSFALASERRVFAQWGIASHHPLPNKAADVKFVELGIAGEEGIKAYTIGVGGWVDHTGYNGNSDNTSLSPSAARKEAMRGLYANDTASNSYFFEGLIGLEPKSEHFYISYKIGPAFITNPDALLGSMLQISQEVGIGMRDIRDVRVGVVIKHMSNAGLIRPNLGRDFIGLRIEW